MRYNCLKNRTNCAKTCVITESLFHCYYPVRIIKIETNMCSTFRMRNREGKITGEAKKSRKIMLAFCRSCTSTSRFILTSKTVTNRKEIPFSTLIHFPNITLLFNKKKTRNELFSIEINSPVRYVQYQVCSRDALRRTYNSQNYVSAVV